MSVVVAPPVHSDGMGNALGSILQQASDQAGVFSAAQARRHGLSKSDIWRAEDAGLIETRARGVYRAAGSPPSWDQDLWVGCLSVGRDVAVGGRAAAQKLGIRGFTGNALEFIVRTGGSHPRPPRGRLRETFWLPDDHIVIVDGLRVTNVARTVFDQAGNVRRGTLRHPVRREAHKRWVKRTFNGAMGHQGLTIDGAVRMIVVLGRRGKPGTAIIREIVKEFGVDYVPTDTNLEFSFCELLEANNIEQPERQVDMSEIQGWIGCVDFLYRRRRVVIEVDGPDHDTPLQKMIDRERDALLRAAGWEVLRIHWLELLDNPERVLRRVLAALRASAA